jgi:molybdopterin synthase sulfur carrier subunit
MNSITKTIRLSASLRQIAGAKEAVVDVPPGATVAELLDALTRAYPALGARILDDNGSLNAGIQLLIDGRHIDFLQGVDSPVEQARDLMLIPPVSGG